MNLDEYNRLRRIERTARTAMLAFKTWDRPPWKELIRLCEALKHKDVR